MSALVAWDWADTVAHAVAEATSTTSPDQATLADDDQAAPRAMATTAAACDEAAAERIVAANTCGQQSASAAELSVSWAGQALAE